MQASTVLLAGWHPLTAHHSVLPADPQVFLRESLTDLRDHFAQGTHGLQDTMLSWGQVLSYVDSIDIKRDADRYVPIDPFLSKRAA